SAARTKRSSGRLGVRRQLTPHWPMPRAGQSHSSSENDMPLTKEQHLDPKAGPKRILALDGGGIRGILTLEFLKAVESLVRQRLGEDALLCDYFDLIGGTSTGSI